MGSECVDKAPSWSRKTEYNGTYWSTPLYKVTDRDREGQTSSLKRWTLATYNVLNVALANGSKNYFLAYPCERKLASHHLVFVKAFKGTRQPVRNSSQVKFFLALRQFYRECESSTYLELVCARRLNQNIPGTQLNQHSGHHQNEVMLWWKTQSAQSDGSG